MIAICSIATGFSVEIAAQDRKISRSGLEEAASALKIVPNAPAASEQVSPSAVLYDQYDSPTTGVTSQNFEAAYDPYDSFAADDFVVPAGQVWNVNQIDVDGSYSGTTPGPASSVNVAIYSNTASNLPGTAICGYTTGFAAGPASGDFIITLPSACTLAQGTYWVSVQTNQNLGTSGQWYWTDRSVQSNSGAAWMNPGGGFGIGCTSWTTKTTCGPSSPAPDQVFRLSGTASVVTAGDASISGRVMAYGRPVSRAIVSFYASDGSVKSTMTNSFGYYKVNGLPVGSTYTATVTDRRYTFDPQVVNLMDNVAGLDFQGR
jgi:hypothetical protein